jgi:hypothetical protein
LPSRYCSIVGTRVRDRKYEVSMANTTAIARGTKSELAAPAMKTTGKKTMQMHSVETNAGAAISWAPSRIACTRGLRRARRRWKFSTSTVASSTRIPTASARPPRVMRFSVCPSRPRTMIETRSASGIDTSTISVLRQLPRKSSIMSPVRPAAIVASRTTPSIAPPTNTD